MPAVINAAVKGSSTTTGSCVIKVKIKIKVVKSIHGSPDVQQARLLPTKYRSNDLIYIQ
jgi:hypothetical protein